MPVRLRPRAPIRRRGFPPVTATFERKTDADKWSREALRASIRPAHRRRGRAHDAEVLGLSLCRNEAVTMKKNLEIFVAFALLAAAGTAAPQQVSPPAPAPAQFPAQPPQPPAKPALKLRLDEVDLRRAITFAPNDGGKKQDAAQSLPGLGGDPSKSWGNSTPSTVIPPTNDNL